MRRPSKDQAGQSHQWHQSSEEQLAGTHTRRPPSRCRCGQEEACGAAGPSWSHSRWYPRGWVPGADCRSRASGRRPDQRSRTTKSGSCHWQLLTATRCLPRRPWAFTESKGGPGKFGKSPIVRQGRGRRQSQRIEGECGHLTEPMVLGPMLTNTRYTVLETHSLWQGAK